MNLELFRVSPDTAVLLVRKDTEVVSFDFNIPDLPPPPEPITDTWQSRVLCHYFKEFL